MAARPRLADTVRAACSASTARMRRSCAAGTDGDVTAEATGPVALCCALLPIAAQRLLAPCNSLRTQYPPRWRATRFQTSIE